MHWNFGLGRELQDLLLYKKTKLKSGAHTVSPSH